MQQLTKAKAAAEQQASDLTQQLQSVAASAEQATAHQLAQVACRIQRRNHRITAPTTHAQSIKEAMQINISHAYLKGRSTRVTSMK